jgi:hypothetical protein
MSQSAPSPYKVRLDDLEAASRVADQDRVEEQDVSPVPDRFLDDAGDVPGHPGVRSRP